MAKLCVLVAVVFVFGVQSAPQKELTCSVASLQEDMEKSLMSCMISEPLLMMEIMKNMRSPDKMENIGFICDNKQKMAALLNCMIHKFSECVPPSAQDMIFKIIPDEKRWGDVFTLVCDNKEVLSEQCMSPTDSQRFLQCYTEKLGGLSNLVSTLGSSENLNPLLCKVISWDMQCFKANAGSCSGDYLDLMMRLLKMVVSVPNCPMTLAGHKLENALSSIMVHGHPLHFQPQGEARYKTPGNY
ncbi:uncharacterized protein LOC101858369 isoform X2 [Aplysia californica]|uniref:Uncharacterized protein LOC101858369 isoform X2 n=1 Tax=Aplysia californica TaxID=6500 RepID=A0ABM0K825_APLCA|nr:uncharacterized protein LOC101858369 isoform X2 [Aplysia californica]